MCSPAANTRWDDVSSFQKRRKREQPQPTVRPNSFSSRRKQNACKAFKTSKTTKERRNASKTLEKKRRRQCTRLDTYDFTCCQESCPVESDDVDRPQPPMLSSVSPIGTTESTELPTDNAAEVAQYQLFGAFPLLKLIESIRVQAVHVDPIAEITCAFKCPPLSTIPQLPLSTPPNARTIKFLQQELDVLSLLSFSGIALDDIPTVFHEEYGVDVSLPDSITPKEMLQLSQRVFVYEYMGNETVALTNPFDFSNQRKHHVIFFAKQEFRLLSIIGNLDGGSGMSLSRLDYLFEEKYHESIVLPTGLDLYQFLFASQRVSFSDSALGTKCHLIPFTFL